jgi:NAD(P)-dependent dehydrogenase (short-subunit alcohol dehydrogenase family)
MFPYGQFRNGEKHHESETEVVFGGSSGIGQATAAPWHERRGHGSLSWDAIA